MVLAFWMGGEEGGRLMGICGILRVMCVTEIETVNLPGKLDFRPTLK